MNWIELKALNRLYNNEVVKLNNTLTNSGEINYLINSLQVLDKTHATLYSLEGFCRIYERDYLKKYNDYHFFLSENQLLKSQTRFEENDIQILMNIYSLKQEGSLDELRRQIIEWGESLRGIAQMFFKNEKYLDDKKSIVEALKKILEIEYFANEKDQQYIYKLECENPVAIILCENIDFLTKPLKPRKYRLELWYAGGKNVEKLDYADARGLPIYYLCDWDYDGLFIIYPLVKTKIPSIKLLTPNGMPRDIARTEHKSLWEKKGIWKLLSELPDYFYSDKQKQLITQLVNDKAWIIEESNDIIKLLEYPLL